MHASIAMVAKKGPVDAIDHRHVGVMVDPPDANYQERNGVGGVLRPRVLELRPEVCTRSVHGDVDDQERRGDREDAVGKGFESAGLHGPRRYWA